MGRTKLFDPQIALMKAMTVFWKKGYDGTSMEDLLQAMKISRSSFYSNWADKESIYLATIDAFTDLSEHAFNLFTLSSNEQASLPEIIRQFAFAFEFQILDKSKGSCYVTNCALELGSLNHEVMNASNKFFRLYHDKFKFALKNGVKKGEISSELDLDSTAWYLINAISGLSVLNKAGVSPEEIEKVILNSLSIFGSFTREQFYKAKNEVSETYAPPMNQMMKELGL